MLNFKKGDLFFQKTGKYYIILLENCEMNKFITKVYGKSFIDTSPLLHLMNSCFLKNFKKLSK